MCAVVRWSWPCGLQVQQHLMHQVLEVLCGGADSHSCCCCCVMIWYFFVLLSLLGILIFHQMFSVPGLQLLLVCRASGLRFSTMRTEWHYVIKDVQLLLLGASAGCTRHASCWKLDWTRRRPSYMLLRVAAGSCGLQYPPAVPSCCSSRLMLGAWLHGVVMGLTLLKVCWNHAALANVWG
jgi:hypothetical protein